MAIPAAETLAPPQSHGADGVSVMAPITPTEVMIARGVEAAHRTQGMLFEQHVKAVWVAMIAAAHA